MEPSPQENQIFVCYSRKDTAMIRAIIEALEEMGHKFWMDKESIAGAETWRDSIAIALHKANTVLFFASKNSYASEHVKEEIFQARSNGCQIIPVRLDDAKPNVDGNQLILNKLQYIRVESKRDMAGIEKIHNAITGGSRPTSQQFNSKASFNRSTRSTLVVALLLLTGLGAAAIYWLPDDADHAETSTPPERNPVPETPAEIEAINPKIAKPEFEVQSPPEEITAYPTTEIEKFITSFVNSYEGTDPRALLSYFGQNIVYFDNHEVTTKNDLLTAFSKYLEDWPERTLKVTKIDIVENTVGEPISVDVNFRYTLGNSEHQKTESGTGQQHLTINKTADDLFVIASISGDDAYPALPREDPPVNIKVETIPKSNVTESRPANTAPSAQPQSPGRLKPSLGNDIEIVPPGS